MKCTRDGVECGGYGRKIVWNDGIASRGKMMGRTYGEMKSLEVSIGARQDQPSEQIARRDTRQMVSYALIDPLLQSLDPKSRSYFIHCKLNFLPKVRS